MVAREGRGSAQARAALAGNPSDGYGGAVLALTLPEFEAGAVARWAPTLTIEPPSELVAATARRFARALGGPAALQTRVGWTTTVPRGVGLGGSSAIVTATLRALCERYEIGLGPDELASFALAVETEELGIAAGLQDRVVQAYGGLVFMNFRPPTAYEPLEPGLLPPLLIAWRDETAGDSHIPHSDLKARFKRSDPVVIAGIAKLTEAARDARGALLGGDLEAFVQAVDRSFDARQSMMALDPRHVEMVYAARRSGAGANYTGSGGAIVAVCRDDATRRAAHDELAGLGCRISTTAGAHHAPPNLTA
jgi:glucuronokinase